MKTIEKSFWTYRIIIFQLLFLLFLQRTQAQTWTKVDMTFPQGDSLLHLANIDFVTRNVGWIFTSTAGIDINDRQSKIYKTIDGGKSWTMQYKGNSFLHVSIFSLDSSHCWALDEYGSLIFTSDGGAEWNTSIIEGKRGDYFNLLFFFNSKEGIAFNSYPWFTTDGGKSWTVGDTNKIVFLSPTDVTFMSNTQGWIVGQGNPAGITEAGFIASTTDGGKTWKYQDHPYPDSTGPVTPMLAGVDFIDSLTGFVVGNDVRFRNPYILFTTNGGENWARKQLIGAGTAYDIGFLDKNNGWFTSGAGRIWKTTDRGATWNLQNIGVDARLGKIIILRKEKVAYVFGDNEFQLPFTLLFADLSSVLNVYGHPIESITKFTLLQSYPNPFNSQTIIEYSIDQPSLVQLKIYDILGKEVKTLVKEDQNSGLYTTYWNGRDNEGKKVASGVYLCRLVANEKIEGSKLILAK